jgi:hypothetical protein
VHAGGALTLWAPCAAAACSVSVLHYASVQPLGSARVWVNGAHALDVDAHRPEWRNANLTWTVAQSSPPTRRAVPQAGPAPHGPGLNVTIELLAGGSSAQPDVPTEAMPRGAFLVAGLQVRAHATAERKGPDADADGHVAGAPPTRCECSRWVCLAGIAYM